MRPESGLGWIGSSAYGGPEDGLYSTWARDAGVARRVCEIEGVRRFVAPIVLEGGAIHVDGEGTLIATRQSVLNTNRNAGRSEEEVEGILKNFLGIQKIIWLDEGVHADETDGHIDNLCCFARPGEVCLTWSDDESDPQYAISRSAFQQLSTYKDARGRSLKIHRLPHPGPLYRTSAEAQTVIPTGLATPRVTGERLAGSYVNFYIASRHIVFPLLDDRWDAAAGGILSSLFPEREVIGVPAREILLGGGNIHCITQQVPIGRVSI